MIRDNRQKTSRNPLYGMNLDWNCLTTMRIVHDLHYYWISRTEKGRVRCLGDKEKKSVSDDTINLYCDALASHFSELLGKKISSKAAFELSLDFFARAEPNLSMEQQRERYKHSSIVMLAEMVWDSGFEAGEDYANSLWEADKEGVRKMEGSVVGKEGE